MSGRRAHAAPGGGRDGAVWGRAPRVGEEAGVGAPAGA